MRYKKIVADDFTNKENKPFKETEEAEQSKLPLTICNPIFYCSYFFQHPDNIKFQFIKDSFFVSKLRV